MLPSIKNVYPSNDLSYDAYIEETCSELKTLNIKIITDILQLSLYIYYRTQWGITHFGLKPIKIFNKLKENIYTKLSIKQMYKYYKMAELLNYIKTNNYAEYKRIMVSVNTGIIDLDKIIQISYQTISLTDKRQEIINTIKTCTKK